MSPASQWFSKRILPLTPKSLTSDGSDPSIPPDKFSLPSKKPDSFKFINFASVMGRRSKLKKPRPTLAIPDYPVPSLVSPPPVLQSGPPPYTSKPPTKSISSTVRSGDDSLEPIPPLCVHRDRGSLPVSVLTLSDPDPFAAGAISVPQSVLDRGRLSAHSSTSENHVFSNKGEVDVWQRPSSASTSSHSIVGGYRMPSLESTLSPLSTKADGHCPWSREMAIKSEIVDVQKSQGSPVEYSYLDKIPKASLPKYGSLSTLTGRKGYPDSPAAVIRTTNRTRCYTEASSSRSSIISRPSKGSTSPSAERLFRSRTFSHRQSSATSHVSPELDEFPSSAVRTSSSSSISFISNGMTPGLYAEDIINSRHQLCKEISLGFDPDLGTPHQSVKESSRIHVGHVLESSPAPPAFHQLKKSMSHSTLQKAKLDSNNSNALQNLYRGNKDLRRQHSFHQSHRDAPTSMPASATPLDHESSNESHKPTFPHPQTVVRRRLFSGSNRRPSTATVDEDMRSVFSLPTEAQPYVASTRAVLSLLDEPSSEPLASGMVYPAIEFTPQRIMSPAEMLKVEATVQDEFDAKYGEAVRNRQRGISTPMYGTYTKEGMNKATSFSRSASTRNAPNVSKGPTPTSLLRPSSAQTASSSASMSPSSSTTSPRLGLLHPPRPRSRPRTAETTHDGDFFNRRMSTVPFTPLSPPPPRMKRPNRAPSIMSEKVAPQRSVMRKPSFLEIADEAYPYDGSFLDFDSGKESFDFS